MSMILGSVEGRKLPFTTIHTFRQAVRRGWPDAQFIDYTGTPLALTSDHAADVFSDSDMHARLLRHTDGFAIAADEEEFRCELAAWAGLWVSRAGGWIVMDDGATWVIPLRPGMTAAQAEAALVVPDWDATPHW